MNEIAISLKNVSKYYKLYDRPKDRLKESLSRKGKQYHKKFYATKNLNLEIKKGEILGIVGKNGSGKSTLLKLITGVLKPDEGSVTVNGKISALLELGSGFNPEFTGMQNIFFYGTILGFTKEEMQEKLGDILTFADIGDFIHQPLKTYSSGMKSRLGFAVAVHIDPEILILDEVLAVGDELFKRKCYAKMEEFFKGGKTIIYVSHDANSVRALCTRAIFLDAGKILLDADAKKVSTFYEKFLFAKDTNKEKVKKEIESLLQDNENAVRITENETINNSEEPSTINAYYIPEFIPKSTVIFKNYDVEIIEPHIIQLDGTQVNVLVHGKEYKFCYRIKFDLCVSNVSVSMNIKNDKGVPLTGSSLTTFEKEITLVNRGEVLEICWNFQCQLLPATYYFNVGCSSIINNERVVLHRIVDAICFKVISSHPSKYWGYVSLEQYPTIKYLENH